MIEVTDISLVMVGGLWRGSRGWIWLDVQVLHAKPTPCHNINIFEAIFQIDATI